MSRITAETRIAGVVGHPVRHSLSPVIHNAWIAASGLDAVYLAFAPPRDGFRRFAEGLRGGVVLGLNVTIPFKEEALAFADSATDAARRAGAANVLVFRPDGSTEADNTDGIGLIVALEEAGCRPGAGPVVILGAGGAARGAVLALLEAGAPEIRVLNRTPERAEAIAELDPRIRAMPWDSAANAFGDAAAVVNATSLGMLGQPPLDVPLQAAAAGAVVMDMVYKPLKTDLLRAAEDRGMPTADGLSMLIGQAVPSFQAFFGRHPSEADVRRLCEEALGQAR